MLYFLVWDVYAHQRIIKYRIDNYFSDKFNCQSTTFKSTAYFRLYFFSENIFNTKQKDNYNTYKNYLIFIVNELN